MVQRSAGCAPADVTGVRRNEYGTGSRAAGGAGGVAGASISSASNVAPGAAGDSSVNRQCAADGGELAAAARNGSPSSASPSRALAGNLRPAVNGPTCTATGGGTPALARATAAVHSA